MKVLYKTKLGSVISECETFEDVAKSFGCIGFTLPGRVAKAIIDKEQKQEEDPAVDQKHRSTINDEE